MKDLTLHVRENTSVNGSFMQLVLDAPAMVPPVPGQFVNVRVSEGEEVILRRPFSVFRFADGRLTILYRVIGKGTEALAGRRPGDGLKVLGPLGTPFPLREGPALLVGGGIGIPPVHFLGTVLAAAGSEVTTCLGFRSAGELMLEESFAGFSRAVAVATDDGTAGVRGTVLDALASLPAPAPGTAVYACGPAGMLRALKAWCGERSLPLSVSLEAYMGCGFGVCLSCAVKLVGTEEYVRACTEGPVFDASLVDL